MTLLLNQVVQAQCPGCQHTLKIPANWIHEPMKCKHCGLVFQAKPPQPSKKNFLSRAFQSSSGKSRKEKKPAAPAALASKPYSPPPGVPVGVPTAHPGMPPAAGVPVAMPGYPTAQGAVPTARPVSPMGFQSVPTAAPVAMPVPGGMMSPGVPTAATIPMGVAGGQAPGGFRRRSRGGWQKLAFVLVFFLGVGGVGAVIYQQAGLDLSNFGEQAAAGTDPATQAGALSTAKTGAKETGPATRPSVPRTKIFDDPIPTKPVATKPTQPTGIRPTNRPTEPIRPTGPDTRPVDTRPVDTSPIVSVPKGSFPRRLLVVSVNNYPFMSPVNYGNADRALERVVRQLASLMRVPDDQVTLLSDRAPVPFPPVKETVEQTIKDYLAGSRPQDRVMLMFIGHCVEIDDTPYLVPLEGDPENKEKGKDSLISIDWLYQELAKCPAQQKVLILDVGRYDPAQGALRGKVSPMGQKTDDILAKPPKGVQVLTACTAGQRSLEMDNRVTRDGLIDGGIFINQIPMLHSAGGLKGIVQKPDEPFPMEELTRKLRTGTKAMAESFFRPQKKDDAVITQTPRLVGEVMVELPFDQKAALPPKVTPKLPKIFENGVAGRDDLLSMLKVTTEIPAIKAADKANPFRAESLPPFPKDVVKNYKDDGKDSPLRVAVMDGIQALQKSDKTFRVDEVHLAPANEQAKLTKNREIENIQKERVGEEIFGLKKIREELEELKELREKEPKLWQANYDYVMARLYAREAYILEYTAKLGEIRKDSLPPRDPQLHRGWRLAAKEDPDELTDKDGLAMLKQSRSILKKMAKEHQGTPWELIAKREEKTVLGMDWKPN